MSPDVLSGLTVAVEMAIVVSVGAWLKKRYGTFPALVGAAFVLFFFAGLVTG